MFGSSPFLLGDNYLKNKREQGALDLGQFTETTNSRTDSGSSSGTNKIMSLSFLHLL
jgi:hypothetical protein